MRLVSFCRDGREGVGVLLDDDAVLDLSAVEHEVLAGRAGDMLSFIEGGKETLSVARGLAARPPAGAVASIQSLVLLAPVPRPRRNVFCVGRNYSDHVKEGDRAQGRETAGIPEWPQFFTKAPQSVVGPGADIPDHAQVTSALDYEAEMALVIGKRGVDIPVERALEHVYGWTIANDVTARDVQRRHVQFFKGKSLDGSCPLGPWIVPAQDLDASDLAIRLWVNGELRQDSRTSHMIFDVPAIIAQLSAGMALEPGDIILTGTPEGVGYAMKPPRALKAGDRIDIEIEGIGRLANAVAGASSR